MPPRARAGDSSQPDADADDREASGDTSLEGTTVAGIGVDEQALPAAAAEADLVLEGAARAYEVERVRHRASAALRQSRGRHHLVFWGVMAMLGVALVVHAIIVQWKWYIVAACVVAPVSFIQFWRHERMWQGRRSLRRAVEESLGDGGTGSDE